MKRITMIFIATLTLALLAYAQSRTLVTQKGTAAQRIATPQDAQKAIKQGILGQLTAKVNTSLRTYPSSTQISKIANPKTRNILEQGRRLLEAGKTASSWNATKLSNFANQVEQHLKEVEATAKALKNDGGTTPQEDCGAAKDRCNDACHARDAGYFCFFDCRLEYVICLGGTLFKVGGGGVIIR